VSVGESLPEGNVLALNSETVIQGLIQWFNVLLLAAVLIRLLYGPVKKFMADRMERIKNDIDSARLNNEQSVEIKANYQQMLDNIDKEREEILSEAHRLAVKKSDQILFDAQEEAKYLLIKANDEIKMERENAADEIRMQII
jgi:F-type H+-transporting ATPase subunit b